jgi:flavin-dependent dehydrogenase
VVVADGGSPPIDKACGEGILPPGVVAARALGVDLSAVPSFPLRGIRFYSSGSGVEADFPSFPEAHGAGVRRIALHRALIKQAAALGVDLRWKTPVVNLRDIKAGWIVGADGMSSRVRLLSGLGSAQLERHRFGFRRHMNIAPWSEFVEIYWSHTCQIYVTPVAADEVGIALLTRDPHQRVDDAITLFPALAERLKSARASSTERGAITLNRVLQRVTRGRTVLIGDAAGSADAISGEGLSLAFELARYFGDAVETGDPAHYESAYHRLLRRPRFMANLMLTMDGRPWLQRRAIPALAARPEVFRHLLALHVGAGSPPRLAADCLTLGWQMLFQPDPN